jgi:hypothetical protein
MVILLRGIDEVWPVVGLMISIGFKRFLMFYSVHCMNVDGSALRKRLTTLDETCFYNLSKAIEIYFVNTHRDYPVDSLSYTRHS